MDIIKESQKACDLLNSAERVVIISHVSPDADSVGANCALKEALRKFSKEVVSACIDPVPENCLFLNGAREFVNDFPVNEFDLIVAVDCGSGERTGFHEKPGFLNGKVPIINIDHHGGNDNFGAVNLVMPDASSTCLMLMEMFEFCGHAITSSIATSFLAGIYFDTGSLMHSNTTPDVFKAVSKLIKKGANLNMVVKNLFKTASVQKMRLWGKILERSRINDEGIVTSAATEEDYIESGGNPDDVSGAVNFLNSVVGSKFCILLSESKTGKVRGSVRTQREDMDVGEIAAMLGGGGHKKAAGFDVPGKIREERVFRIVKGD
ncbi:MAG: bifunctional oligoribonuclease/PAP phosphatase NrnA [Patescibacteria group bacterium]|nr:bifunctional oligoribonuclease/PAP phosphatase NrnA [Patescibacteria group bacterium]